MRLDYRRIHLVGAGGAGMSAIAKVLAGMGHVVSGSDQRGGSTLDRLEDFGIAIHTGHHPEVARTADLVVASSAVPDQDPELVAAAERRGAGMAPSRPPCRSHRGDHHDRGHRHTREDDDDRAPGRRR